MLLAPLTSLQPETLYPSRALQAVQLAGSLLFAGIGAYVAAVGVGAGFVLVALFGLLSAVFAAELILRRSHLRLDEAGLEVSSLLRARRLSWADVAGFGAVTVPMRGVREQRMVVYWTHAGDARRGGTALRGADFDGGLSHAYGLTEEALAGRLNDRLDRAHHRRSAAATAP
jgi:hypothetical protein